MKLDIDGGRAMALLAVVWQEMRPRDGCSACNPMAVQVCERCNGGMRLPAPDPALHVSAPTHRGAAADARLGLA